MMKEMLSLSTSTSTLALLLIIIVHLTTTFTNAKTIPPFKNGVPGSGYGCNRKCGGDGDNDDGDDVNYVIRASLQTYPLHLPTYNQEADGGMNVSMFTRTFEGVAEESSPFCNDDDGTHGPLGPCLTVNPGQRINIKIINDMTSGMEQLQQHKVQLREYWRLAAAAAAASSSSSGPDGGQQQQQPDLDKITWHGKAPQFPSEDINTIPLELQQNLPGWDATFDDVNLHLHGMQVVPHLFYPQGTGDPKAPWITITPENENPLQSCFCYVFDVPIEHPQGSFFYHVHRHGSVAMQSWQGMFGWIFVGNADNPGSPDYELKKQGVDRSENLALWEWAVTDTTRLPGQPPNTYVEGQFLSTEMIQIFNTNNDFQPSIDMCVNEVAHMRLLCAQTTTGSALYIASHDDKDTALSFWVFASDGISYSKAYEKRMIVVGPGQRQGLLLKFSAPGVYYLWQNVLNDFQGTGEIGPNNLLQVALTIHVDKNCMNNRNVDPTDLVFTPGMSYNVSDQDVSNEILVNFHVQSPSDRDPIPQFVINGKPFDNHEMSHAVEGDSSAVWTLTSNQNFFHPFHIHVNPFQVKDMTSGELPGELAGISLMDAVFETNLVPPNMWRDTVFIAPFGTTQIYQRFGQGKQENGTSSSSPGTVWTGKTVYHCHFLDHEDQGMMAAMVILEDKKEDQSTYEHDHV